jgi:CheY-like chemotaxis protein
MENRGRILVLSDDADMRETVSKAVIGGKYEIAFAESSASATANLRQSFYHLAIIDLDSLGRENVPLITELVAKEFTDSVFLILIGAELSKEEIRRAFTQPQVADVIPRGEINPQKLSGSIKDIFARWVQTNFDLDIVCEDQISRDDLVLGMKLRGERLGREHAFFARVSQEVEDLLQKLFYSAVKIVIRGIPEKSSGYSGTKVFKVQPFYSKKHGNSVIVKYGEYEKIRTEYERYKQFVEGFVGENRSTSISSTRRTPLLGGIVYSLIGTEIEKTESFSEFYRKNPVVEIAKVLDDLFENTCGNWYADRSMTRYGRLSQEYGRSYGISASELEGVLRDTLPTYSGKSSIQFTEFPNREFVNPLHAISSRDLSAASHSCVTHGDFNGNNILVDNSHRTWLIDFAHTGESHILRDCIELERVVKFVLLDSGSLLDRRGFEEVLLSADSFSASMAAKYDPPSDEFEKAFFTVTSIRQHARSLVYPSDNLTEYYIGLLFASLGTLRFYDVPEVNRRHALLSAALLCERLRLRV